MSVATSSSSFSVPERSAPLDTAPSSVASSAVCAVSGVSVGAEPPADGGGGEGAWGGAVLQRLLDRDAGVNDRGLDGWSLRRPAVVLGLAEPQTAQQAETVLRLMELGFLPGQQVRVVARGAWGREPLAVRVGGSTFALRRHEAALVRVGEVRA